ncbi:MAG: MaoC family dehydratase, partial [Nocardioides sp.]|nr:MaoC family dehydratase [Nocardioides sp.]
DAERAAWELPSGTTIAHGLLTLALVPGLRQELLHVRNHGRALNYGQDRVRFPAPVPVGSRIRLRVRVESTSAHRDGVLVRLANTMEMEGSDKPAMVADSLTLVIG